MCATFLNTLLNNNNNNNIIIISIIIIILLPKKVVYTIIPQSTSFRSTSNSPLRNSIYNKYLHRKTFQGIYKNITPGLHQTSGHVTAFGTD